MPIDREEVEHVAYLARLGLTEEEKARLQDRLNAILDYMRIIGQVDVSSIPPTASVLPLESVIRQVQVRPSLPVEAVLANAPAREDDFFRIPPVLEGE